MDEKKKEVLIVDESKERNLSILKNFNAQYGGVSLPAMAISKSFNDLGDSMLPKSKDVETYGSKKVRMFQSQSYKENHKKAQGRNTRCRCNSGKKYKHCCINKKKEN